ncbi:zinc finger MYM-type protein 1-like [Camellia sinensis]|uniref:zinc finger MYM-type protein 1-like n=1 Tax=Camellia sinensis TaxID=4442 RepID=UPI00103599A9|nr:zinc finger MYM-type protein 1-like [Camellia sinensis]
MQHFVYVVIFSNPILEIKLVVLLLLTIFFKQSDQALIEYRICLNASVDCVKFLLRQGLAFCGHDEYESSSNQGNFFELLKFLADHNEDVKVVALSNAPQNLKLASPDIQKDIVNVAAFETINVIIRDHGDTLFSILIDETCDISIKEQMAVVIQYVDKKSQVIDRFLGIEYVANTNALSLKQVVENLFSRLGLSISRLRGQGYDRASNMQVIDVLEMISEDGSNSEQRAKANLLLDLIQSFEFVFNLHLMKTILAITSELSQALQRKDQDIVNVMNLVQISKVRLQKMRESVWASLLDDILSFCKKHEIDVLQIDDMFVVRGRKRRNAQEITNLHHYHAELFYTVLDMQIQELNAYFTESNTELLLCVACLNPSNSFSSFDRKKLIHLTEFYPKEFSLVELMKIVETGRDKVYPLVYLLLTLALILPVATATVGRVFSAMNIVKNRLRNRMGDEWMNDGLVVYIKRDIFDSIDNDTIMERFQTMKTCRDQL